MTRTAFAFAFALAWLCGLGTPAVRAQIAPAQVAPMPAASAATLENIDAFEHGFAVSLFQFDACGDSLAGRMFRRALAERFAQCPFSAEARARFQRRTAAEFAKARKLMADAIEAEGGLPHQVAGMGETCQEHRRGPAYVAFRARLEDYQAGYLRAQQILPASCDAADILP